MDYKFVSKKLESKSAVKSPAMSKMISQKTIDLLNYRINQEELSSRIYLAMHLWLQDRAYFNAAKLWKKFSDEELNHANWAREFLLDYDITPETRALEVVPNSFEGLPNIVYKTLEHETLITKQCHELLKHSFDDLYVMPLAQKYVQEQGEEVGKAVDLVTLLENYGTDKLAVALYDHELERFL